MIRPLICEWGDTEHEKNVAQTIALNGLGGHRVMVFDGTYGLAPIAYWFRNRPSDEPMQFDKSEKYPGWFKYRIASFRSALIPRVSAFSSIFWEDRDNCSVTQFATQVVMNSHYCGHGEAPTELTTIQRQKISDAISTLELKTPELPEWLSPTPVAAIGEIPAIVSGESGSVICPITEEFAMEIAIQWTLHHRDATEEEIKALEEQLQ